MEWVDALVLGLVQGITEFLPISSTGHLVLVREWMQMGENNGLAYDAVLHLATTLAVLFYFKSDVWALVQVALRKLGRLPVNAKDLTLLYALVIGTIPAGVMGLLLESYIEDNFRSSSIVAVVLFLTAIFFMYTEWRYYLRPVHEELTLRTGLLIGLFQTMALLPGMSRSGSTIAGGMLLGLNRYEASKFSFLLAIPITLAVGLKKMIDLLKDSSAIEAVNVPWSMLGLSAAVTFVVALLVIHLFLGFIRKNTLWPFAWYSVILSGMVGYVHFFLI